ncbi:hypothetical protein PIB30_009958 [Stylosanthes scabra]|uniref:Uncharacterized protein n=1 Tax=Stylosanthes scabra TaxID=79078 RepID=A0ABU6T569_9FABA|nr:hypothetical protein [Stylosanthes scabra]
MVCMPIRDSKGIRRPGGHGPLDTGGSFSQVRMQGFIKKRTHGGSFCYQSISPGNKEERVTFIRWLNCHPGTTALFGFNFKQLQHRSTSVGLGFWVELYYHCGEP